MRYPVSRIVNKDLSDYSLPIWHPSEGIPVQGSLVSERQQQQQQQQFPEPLPEPEPELKVQVQEQVSKPTSTSQADVTQSPAQPSPAQPSPSPSPQTKKKRRYWRKFVEEWEKGAAESFLKGDPATEQQFNPPQMTESQKPINL